mmetsp:Transcript_80004/g.232281  ORF Transcript_80004/g.232281 Transcript_80004/m.232281 type:complete len:117 (+) Transcript_80004:2146-2496(+)
MPGCPGSEVLERTTPEPLEATTMRLVGVDGLPLLDSRCIHPASLEYRSEADLSVLSPPGVTVRLGIDRPRFRPPTCVDAAPGAPDCGPAGGRAACGGYAPFEGVRTARFTAEQRRS